MNANITENLKRNPNISKWNILFEREGKQWMSVRPQEGTEVYTCYACRELFGCKVSFLDHVNRFTIVLSFKCDMCPPQQEFQFYNPCAFLLHSRQHYSPFGGHICLDDITVSCLPLGLVGFPPHQDIPMLYDVTDDNASIGFNVNTRFYAPNRTTKGKNMISMVPTILLFYHYRINGVPPSSLVLKQICTNIPKCIFTKLETAAITPNVISAVNEKRIAHNEGVININNNNVIINSVNNNNNNNVIINSVNNNNNVIINSVNNNNNDNSNVVINSGNCSTNTEKNSSLKVNHVESNENAIECENNVNNQNSRLESVKNTASANVQAPQGNKEQTNENIERKSADASIEQVQIKAEPADDSSEEIEEILVENPLATPAIVPFAICAECNVHLSDKTLALHVSGLNPLGDAYQCDICKYIAASPCSFRAHKRLHVREPPFICPECGKTFTLNIELLNHLEDVCFHLAKQVRLRCPKKNCCKVFAQLTTFMIHFEVHIQTLNKCTVCNATFYAVRDHLEHSELEHSKVVPSEIIYKCTICKNSTLLAENYRHHVQWHCNDDTLRVYVYVCKFCRNFFRSFATYASHLMRCNKKVLTIEELRRLKKGNAAIVCLHCNYVIRLITKLDDCPRCGRSVNGRSITHFFNKKLTETSSIFPRTIKCILCFKILIFSEAQAHECKYKYPIVVLCKEDDNIKKVLSIKREAHEPASSNEICVRKKRRKPSTSPTHHKHKRSSVNHVDVELRLNEPVPFEGTYKCQLCEYADNDRLSFHEHIKNHRNVSTSYQCMECGECFVVKPSFHKHLVYYHKIINVDEYVKENKCVDESAISELKKHMRIECGEINDDVAENQCKVCLKQFKDAPEFNKHFRMHGMAFLRNNK